MTTKDKVARRKLSTLELASKLNNVSKACRIMGYSRPGRVSIGGDLRFRRRIGRSRSYRPRGRFAKAGIAAPVSRYLAGRKDRASYGIVYCIRADVGVSGVFDGEPGFVPRSQGPHLLEASMSMDDSIRPCSLRASG